MKRAVVVMLDGLRRDCVEPQHMPNLSRFRDVATVFEHHRSVVPSVTRVCSSSFTTGCRPMRHGIEGNSFALREGGGFTVHDTGKPGFLDAKRRLTGAALEQAGLAELLRDCGGSIVYSNVSPGAAYLHDPDGHGHVYHRAGCFGPGRVPLPETEALDIDESLAGDAAMTERFVADPLERRRPAFALLWLGHPDTTQHKVPLGSPAHLAALREADRNVGLVIERVEALRKEGDDILFVIGSDHGHQTVSEVVDVETAIADIGFADALDKSELVVVPNGTAVLIYASEAGRSRLHDLVAALRAQQWVGEVVFGPALAELGQCDARGLGVFVAMTSSEDPNAFGMPGLSHAAKPVAGKPDRLGCGQHGGLGRYEQSPFLAIQGGDFVPGGKRDEDTSLVDLAPTVLGHFGLSVAAMDGRPLQPARARPPVSKK